MPKFYFFVMVDYFSEEAQNKIEKEFETLRESLQLDNVNVLPLLQAVSKRDVERWLEIHYPEQSEELMNTYFNEAGVEEWDMVEVEKRLEKIIKKHNLKQYE